jgi:arsenite methyltransferase
MSADDIRRAVSTTYAATPAPIGAARLAGYTDAQLEAVPAEVADSFMGCGNPLAFASVRPGDTVVDLGSGAGLDLILAGHAVGPTGRVIGVDMTPAMIEHARRAVARAGLANVEIREGLIEALPVADASVDWVISNCVISLSPEKDKVFREIARVLRPNGRMLISDIVVDNRLAWLLARLTRVVPTIAMARTEADYLEAMRAAGLAGGVESRYVYTSDDLIGLFGDGALDASAATCPALSLAGRVRRSPLAKKAIAAAARAVSGHVWSAKLHARSI